MGSAPITRYCHPDTKFYAGKNGYYCSQTDKLIQYRDWAFLEKKANFKITVLRPDQVKLSGL